jgi:hypothetical protein
MRDHKQQERMLIFATKVSIKTHPNIVNCGKCSRRIRSERKRKRRRKMVKEKANESTYSYVYKS